MTHWEVTLLLFWVAYLVLRRGPPPNSGNRRLGPGD